MATGQGFPNSFTEGTGWSQLVFTNLSQSGSSSQLRLEHEGWRLCNWLQLCSRWDLYTRIEMALVHQFEANEKSSFLPIRKQKWTSYTSMTATGQSCEQKIPSKHFRHLPVALAVQNLDPEPNFSRPHSCLFVGLSNPGITGAKQTYCGWSGNRAPPWMVETCWSPKSNGITHLPTGAGLFHQYCASSRPQAFLFPR